MYRFTTILILLLMSPLASSQNTILEKNINYEARYLTQNLSEQGDSLLLKSEKTIEQVDIFNDDFMKEIQVDENETKIDLKGLPAGDYVVQARLGEKRIIMYLTRRSLKSQPLKNIKLGQINQDISITDTKKVRLKSAKTNSKKASTKRVLYWVVYKSNTGSGSRKSMRLENEEVVRKLINKNELEQSTKIGKNNTLLVYEVYDTSAFMKHQLKNPEYYNTSDSEIFNDDPYYSSIDDNSKINNEI